MEWDRWHGPMLTDRRRSTICLGRLPEAYRVSNTFLVCNRLLHQHPAYRAVVDRRSHNLCDHDSRLTPEQPTNGGSTHIPFTTTTSLALCTRRYCGIHSSWWYRIACVDRWLDWVRQSDENPSLDCGYLGTLIESCAIFKVITYNHALWRSWLDLAFWPLEMSWCSVDVWAV